MVLRFASLAVILCAVLATAASAREIYVDNVGGDDMFDGSSPKSRTGVTGPCRTIARALRGAGRCDQIVLANTGVPYRESITLQAGPHSGVPGRPFQILGQGAILDGAAPVPTRAWEHVRGEVFRFPPPRKAYQLLFLDGKPASRVWADPFSLHLPDLKPLQWCLFDRHLYFRTEQGQLPQHYPLTYSALPVGITLYEVRHVVIADLTVQGFQLDGINAHDGVTDAALRGVVCRGNARSGIAIGGSSQVTIEGCLVGNNGTAQVRTEGESHTRIVDSELLDNTAPPLVREGGEVDWDKPPPAPPPPAQAMVPPRRVEVTASLPWPLLLRTVY